MVSRNVQSNPRLELISSAYVHIPFCSYKCDFCDFAAFSGLNHREREYFDVLADEIKTRISGVKSPIRLKSIYFGGGTPGMVKPSYIAEILEVIKEEVCLEKDVEICLETTPHAISRQKLEHWNELGIRRLSIGVESFQDAELRSIGRDHSRREALAGLEMAFASAIDLIGLDFMYGLPTQTIESWQSTLEELVSLTSKHEKLKHVSAYGLELAGNSPLYSKFPKDSHSYPDEELFGLMLQCLIDKMRKAGFVHYEVSNFARPGYQCRHNSTYWKNKPYLAFGVGAHRYVDGVRSSNWRSFNRYLREYAVDETSEPIDEKLRIKEGIMLGLRMRAGIKLADFEEQYGIKLLEIKSREIERLVGAGLLALENGSLFITDKGLPVSNSVIVELI